MDKLFHGRLNGRLGDLQDFNLLGVEVPYHERPKVLWIAAFLRLISASTGTVQPSTGALRMRNLFDALLELHVPPPELSEPGAAQNAKGQLDDLVREKTNYTAENTGRRLREFENDGMLEVQIRKGIAYYCMAQMEPKLF
jgi:hypothetical protein